MDPITAIANAAGDLFVMFGPGSIFGAGRRAQRDRLPDWQNPANYRNQNNTASLIIAGGVVVLLVILLLIAKNRK